MRSEDQTRPIDKLSPFVIDKAIKCTIGTLKSIKKLRNGDFLLEGIDNTFNDEALNSEQTARMCVPTCSYVDHVTSSAATGNIPTQSQDVTLM